MKPNVSPSTASSGRVLWVISGCDMDGTHKQAITMRGAITAVLFFAGFAFPLIWIAAAFFA